PAEDPECRQGRDVKLVETARLLDPSLPLRIGRSIAIFEMAIATYSDDDGEGARHSGFPVRINPESWPFGIAVSRFDLHAVLNLFCFAVRIFLPSSRKKLARSRYPLCAEANDLPLL